MLRAHLVNRNRMATDGPGDTGDQAGMAHPVADIEDSSDLGHHIGAADHPDTGIADQDLVEVPADTEAQTGTGDQVDIADQGLVEVLADIEAQTGTGARVDTADQDQTRA